MSDEFTGHGAALDDEGMENALDLAKVSAAQLWAVLAVETSGNGFFSDRRPKILYERHVFSRLTHQAFDAQHPDISSKSPGSYGATGAHHYDRLNQAISLNRNAALPSASWGLGQTMGFNFAATRSADVEAMIKRMVASENEQLLCTVNQLIEGGVGRGAAGQGLGELRPSLQRPQLRHQQLRLATQRRVSKVLLWGDAGPARPHGAHLPHVPGLAPWRHRRHRRQADPGRNEPVPGQGRTGLDHGAQRRNPGTFAQPGPGVIGLTRCPRKLPRKCARACR